MEELKRLVIAPVKHRITCVDRDLVDFVRDKIPRDRRYREGDVLEVLIHIEKVRFIVKEIDPSTGFFVDDTELIVKGNPILVDALQPRREVPIEELKRLVLVPVKSKINVDKDSTGYIRKRISRETLFAMNDVLVMTFLGKKVKFIVQEIEPRIGQFTDDTELIVQGTPLLPKTMELEKSMVPLETMKVLAEAIGRSPPSKRVDASRVFLGKVISGGRITIPEAVREINRLSEGDIVWIEIKNIRRKTALPTE